MNWVPRWCEAYYNTDSLLRKLYFLGIVYPNDLMMRLLVDRLVPNFYGELMDDRIGFTANYHYPKKYVPSVSLIVSGVSRTVVCKDTYGSFMYEAVLPVYYRGDNLLYFKNLETVSFAATAISGYLDLSSFLAQSTIDPDSPIILENQWGDLTLVDQTSTTYFSVSGHVLVGYNGSYTVYYRSQDRLNRLLAGTDYITIDNETISLTPYHFTNVWDNYAELLGLKRAGRETNKHLKSRLQHLTLAKKTNQRISASLGMTIGINWYASGVTTLPGSFSDWEFQDYYRQRYVEEFPVKDGSNYILSLVPTGYVQVFYKNLKMESTAYSISGSQVISLASVLSGGNTGDVKVSYLSKNLPLRTHTNSTTIEPLVPDAQMYLGILVRGVAVNNSQKKIKAEEWCWNKDLGQLSGLADFDF